MTNMTPLLEHNEQFAGNYAPVPLAPPATQTVIEIREPGGPEVLVPGTRPVPEPKAGKTRIHLDLRTDDLPAGLARVRALGGAEAGQVHVYDEGTVVLMFDPEGRAPGGVSHWVTYGIPPTVTGFAEGEATKDNDKYVGGKSLMGVGHYSGPCTPPNQTAHPYTFVLIATDFDTTDIPPGLTREDVLAKIAPAGQPPAHTKGVTSMVGWFVNPWHK